MASAVTASTSRPKQVFQDDAQAVWNGEGRPDGRSLAEARAAGRTQVVCAAYGPRLPPPGASYSESGSLQCTVKLAPFMKLGERADENESVREAALLARQLENALRAVVNLERLGKAFYEVHFEILQDNGGVFPTAINAASLALASAGVAMHGLVAGASAYVNAKGNIAVDPITPEERAARLLVTVGYIPSLDIMAHTEVVGEGNADETLQALQHAMDAARSLASDMKGSLIRAYKVAEKRAADAAKA